MVHFWWDLHKSQSPTEKSGQEKNEIKIIEFTSLRGLTKTQQKTAKPFLNP